MTPPNGAGGGGTYLPSMVVVALGEPGVPVVWTCALADGAAAITAATSIADARMYWFGFMCQLLLSQRRRARCRKRAS
jgi:hypothetical protein